MGGVGKESKEFEEKAEDASLQMQIVQEERDALREAMEQLWNEWAAIDEELLHYQQSYSDLSERIFNLQDRNCDLEVLVERASMEVAGLQKNGFNALSAAA